MEDRSEFEDKLSKKMREKRKSLRKQCKNKEVPKNIMEIQQEIDFSVKDKTTITYERPMALSTISIAVPGSILENAQSPELRSYVAGQIARAACIFRVDEVVVYDDVGISNVNNIHNNQAVNNYDRTIHNNCIQLARILQYLECPQYLRKSFFPIHHDLKYSGVLNPLDAPHHLRQQNSFQYREGVVIEKKAKPGCSYVNAGLLQDVRIDKALQPGIRVTVKLQSNQNNDHSKESRKKLLGVVVAPDEPRRKCGVYWGYTVRIAHSLLEVFSKSPYSGGYDMSVGTSDGGCNIHEYSSKSIKFEHLLVVFGGLQGLEEVLTNEEKLKVNHPKLLFDHYINTLPRQGSRTIRTEEAIFISMTALQDKLCPNTPEVPLILSPNALANSKDTGLKRSSHHSILPTETLIMSENS